MKEHLILTVTFIIAVLGLGLTLAGFLYIIGWLAQLSNDHPILSILGLCCLIIVLVLLLKGDF